MGLHGRDIHSSHMLLLPFFQNSSGSRNPEIDLWLSLHNSLQTTLKSGILIKIQSDFTNIQTYAEKQSCILNGNTAFIAKNTTENKLYDS